MCLFFKALRGAIGTQQANCHIRQTDKGICREHSVPCLFPRNFKIQFPFFHLYIRFSYNIWVCKSISQEFWHITFPLEKVELKTCFDKSWHEKKSLISIGRLTLLLLLQTCRNLFTSPIKYLDSLDLYFCFFFFFIWKIYLYLRVISPKRRSFLTYFDPFTFLMRYDSI